MPTALQIIQPEAVATSVIDNDESLVPSTLTGRQQSHNTHRPTEIWSDVSGNLNEFNCEIQGSFQANFFANCSGKSPVHYYLQYLDDEIIDNIVLETNKYAHQRIVQGILDENIFPHSVLASWYDTDRHEIMTAVAIIIWMGLDDKPRIRDYWSQNLLYKNDFCKKTNLSRNRFQSLLSMIHFSDNETCPPGNRLHKIDWLVSALNKKFQDTCLVGNKMCIDESMVPFQGRLCFRQDIQNKKSKYGVKLYKLCIDGGTTHTVKVYGGKDSSKENVGLISKQVVLEMVHPLIEEGRTLYTDNYSTSVDLEKDLLDKKTHLVGTLRQKRKHNPKPVVTSKLKRGQISTVCCRVSLE